MVCFTVSAESIARTDGHANRIGISVFKKNLFLVIYYVRKNNYYKNEQLNAYLKNNRTECETEHTIDVLVLPELNLNVGFEQTKRMYHLIRMRFCHSIQI